MKPANPERPLFALGLRIVAMALISTMFVMVKYVAQTGVALPEIMFWRQLVSVPILLGWLAFTGTMHRLRTRRMGSHAFRAATGMFGMLCNLAAAVYLPLAEATTLGFTTPFFAVIVTALYLRETVGPWRWAAVIIGFIGVVVIAQPGGELISPVGTAAGLAAGLMVAIISFQIRDLARTENPISVVFYFALFGSLMMALLLPYYLTSHTPLQWALLLGTGAVGTAGQLLLTASLRHGAVATVVIMDYTSLIWATLYGWLIWDHLPTQATWIGAPLIIGAGVVVAWREHRLARRRGGSYDATPASSLEQD